MDNGRTDYLDDILWNFAWKECPGVTLYQLYVIHEGSAHPTIDVTLSGSPYHYIDSGYYIDDSNRFNWIWKIRASVKGYWGEWSAPVVFDVEPVNTDPPPATKARGTEFKLRDPYRGDCDNRPTGSVCIKFSDGYVWLIHDAIQGSSEAGRWNGKPIIVFYGFRADYYHVLGTSLIKEIPK